MPKIEKVETADLEAALNLIATPYGPERLRVAIRKLGEGGAKKVAAMLQRRRHPQSEESAAGADETEAEVKPILRWLELWSTSIGVAGAEDLAIALTSEACTLEKIDLNWNPGIGDPGCRHFAAGLQSGTVKLKILGWQAVILETLAPSLFLVRSAPVQTASLSLCFQGTG